MARRIDLFSLKRPVLALRSWAPLNLPLTTAIRAAFRLAGRQAPALISRALPRTGLVTAALPGGRTLKMWSRADDDVATEIFWRGWMGFEPETSSSFHKLACSARVTLDIGAHVGYFALLAGQASPEGKVFAFEPLGQVHERLTKNVKLNGLENVVCVSSAAGSRTSLSEFFHVAKGIPSSSSLSEDFMATVARDQPLVSSRVEVITIDDFVKDNGITGVDLVKIDTEGTEHEVLAGMMRTLERDRPAVVCEVIDQKSAKAVERLLASLQYEFFLLTNEGPTRRAHLEPHAVWRNYLALPGQDD